MSVFAALLFVLSPAQLQDDFHVFRQTFEDTHGALYRYTPKAEMDAAFAGAESRLQQPLSEVDFYRVILGITDLVHDAHTSVSLSRETQKRFVRTAKVFPLDVRYAGGRAYIEKNFSSDATIPLGAEVVAVNGDAMSGITERLLQARPVDGFIRSAKIENLNANFWFAYYMLTCDSEVFAIDVRDASGKITRHTVEGVLPQFFDAQWKAQKHDGFFVEYLDEKTALMSIPTFGDLALAGAFANAFRDLRANRARNLIIDIRDNGGGWDELNPELFTYLVPHPFRFYRGFRFRAKDWEQLRNVPYKPEDFLNGPDLKRPAEEQKAIIAGKTLAQALQYSIDTNPADGVFEPKADVFRGNIYLLTNGRSASSGGEVAALFHFLGVGTIVGEEANGAYQGTSGGVIPTFALPHSGIQVRYPMVAYSNNVLPGLFDGRGAPPDFVVAESVDDAIHGRDTVLRFTLDLIEAREAH